MNTGLEATGLEPYLLMLWKMLSTVLVYSKIRVRFVCIFLGNILPIIIQNNFKFETLIKDRQINFNIFKIQLYIKSRRNAKV